MTKLLDCLSVEVKTVLLQEPHAHNRVMSAISLHNSTGTELEILLSNWLSYCGGSLGMGYSLNYMGYIGMLGFSAVLFINRMWFLSPSFDLGMCLAKATFSDHK